MTNMREVEKMLRNRDRLISMGIDVEVNSEYIMIIKTAPKKYDFDWLLYRNFKTLAEFNLFSELLLDLVCEDSDDGRLFDLVAKLKTKGFKRYS